MGRSQESFNKMEIRNKKEKKRKEKEKKRLARKENPTKSTLDDMITYVDENGNFTDEAPDLTKKRDYKLEDIEISIPKADPGMAASKIRTGTVSYTNDSKGFGFIIDSETKERIFVHFNELKEPVKEGNSVTFEIEKGQRGLSATGVRINRG